MIKDVLKNEEFLETTALCLLVIFLYYVEYFFYLQRNLATKKVRKLYSVTMDNSEQYLVLYNSFELFFFWARLILIH